jgi:hypothetical protein
MASEAIHFTSVDSLQIQAEQDLCAALCNSDAVTLGLASGDSQEVAEVKVAEQPHSQIAYPWEPADPEAETFFNQLDEQFTWDDWENGEIERRSQAFYQKLDQLWAVTPLQTALTKKFVTVPQNLLRAIARQAQQLVNTSATVADQLILCVNEVLPQWAPEDLQVLARPLAYAMRSDDANPVETTLNTIRSLDWSELSELEQARMSLAIARYAIDKVNPPV